MQCILKLGVVDSLLEDGNLKASYFTRIDKIGSQWSFPEEPFLEDIQSTSVGQVLCKVNDVGYH